SGKYQQTQPTAVSGMLTAKQVSVGGQHTCALLTDGSISCWGLGAYGQLGAGTTATSPTPVKVMMPPAAAVEIAAGDYHTCARTAAGAVWCWGRNDRGQLGIGSKGSPKSVP